MVKMDSPTACASCAMPIAGKSNHSAAGTTHPLVGNNDNDNDSDNFIDKRIRRA